MHNCIYFDKIQYKFHIKANMFKKRCKIILHEVENSKINFVSLKE